jgi:hypothetical protein
MMFYFTQTLLPDYLTEHPDETASWDVVFDARGTFTEPHTGREVALGTLDVRQYLDDRPYLGPAVDLAYEERFPTSGPEHRFSTVLYIEKEGFGPLLKAARISERFDIGIMSNKGMSVTATRMLLDRLSAMGVRVLVLHDFDVSGFSIFGTLGTDSRRYSFQHKIQLIDLGLRLADVEALGLESEFTKVGGDLEKRQRTLQRHGATRREIEFLLSLQKRVELNAMTAPQFIEFLEKKLIEQGVQKVIPDTATLELHARRVAEQIRAQEAFDEVLEEIRGNADSITLPDDLLEQVQGLLAKAPAMSWDAAVSQVMHQHEN